MTRQQAPLPSCFLYFRNRALSGKSFNRGDYRMYVTGVTMLVSVRFDNASVLNLLHSIVGVEAATYPIVSRADLVPKKGWPNPD
jgi:hypothetical protein